MPARAPHRIDLTRAAEPDLRALPARVLRRVDRVIQGLRDDPRPPGVRKLRGSKKTYRVRVGEYRVLYDIDDKAVVVLVVKVADRKDAY